jgi:putative aldouronate transport system permease protein
MQNSIHKSQTVARAKKYWQIYLLLLPGIIITLIYKYIPMYGVQIAFRDFNPAQGFFGSPWVGMKWFDRFFTNYNSARMIRNTILLSLYSILWTFPIPIVLALLINQMRFKKMKKTIQTILYAPHFISTMIVCGMLRIFLSPYGGLVNIIAQSLGASGPQNFIDNASMFRTIYIASSVWQDAGWGTIIYTATLASVDASLHEAARVDGASTMQRIWFIDIPELIPIIVIQLIMSFGNLMNVGFEKAYLLQTGLNKETSEIIATYVYEQGMLKAMYSFSTAVGLFNTAVNIVLLLIVNKFSKKISDVSFI